MEWQNVERMHICIYVTYTYLCGPKTLMRVNSSFHFEKSLITLPAIAKRIYYMFDRTKSKWSSDFKGVFSSSKLFFFNLFLTKMFYIFMGFFVVHIKIKGHRHRFKCARSLHFKQIQYFVIIKIVFFKFKYNARFVFVRPQKFVYYNNFHL